MCTRNAVQALAAALLIGFVACDSEDVTDSIERDEESADPVLALLSTSGTWEKTANPVALSDALPQVEILPDGLLESTESSLARSAELDRGWFADDGERYDALYIHHDGRSYGRRRAATSSYRIPDAANDFGAFTGAGGVLDADAFARLEADSAGRVPDADPAGLSAQARIGTDWSNDRRSRIASGLTTWPTRTIGALSGNGNTQSSGCSGTKVGPRAVLTAAHCVMGSTGSITFSGRFNPGQTNTTTPNGSITWSGVFLRDWRVHRKYDYAILYLADSPATVGLGWMGVVWWNGTSGYAGRGSKLFGYPCGPNNNCGTIAQQRCKASPRTDKRCDGWMYGHSSLLWPNSYRSDDLLQYDNDMSSCQSGSAVWTWHGNAAAVMAVNTHSSNGVSMGARFRQSMWNDVCTWIGHPAFQSAYATHSLCN
jgi:V8-like Glu-specific endopeptidase